MHTTLLYCTSSNVLLYKENGLLGNGVIKDINTLYYFFCKRDNA